MSKSWIILFVVIGAATLWLSIRAASALWDYGWLNYQVESTVKEWEIDSDFNLVAHYQFEFKNKSYEGKTVFYEPVHLNRYAAVEDLKSFSQKSYKAWISTRNPNHSSLQKIFPLKKCVYALFSLAILSYFFTLHRVFRVKSETALDTNA